MFKFYDPRTLPSGLSIWGSSDFAVTEGDTADFTSLGMHGLSPDGDLYLCLGYWSGQKTADVWIDELCELILCHQPQCLYDEAGPIRRSIEPFLIKRLTDRRAYCRIDWVASIADKSTRARALQARASMGKVWLPDNEVGHAVLHQMLAFPLGRRDDDVDMCSLAARMIDEAGADTGFLRYMEQQLAEARARKVQEPQLHGQVNEGVQLGSAMTPQEVGYRRTRGTPIH